MELAAVIVTYNRLEKLKKTLDAYDKQTRTVDKIIVVDNASKQDTKDYLKEWQSTPTQSQKIIVTLDSNLGGSGGFHYGMKKAQEIGFDYLFIADDDAYPEVDAFEKIENAINKYKVDALCTRVTGPNGIDIMHRRKASQNIFHYKEISYDISYYDKTYFDCDSFSFVGAIISSNVIEKCGYPKKDYFIWCDDGEYAYRVKEKFQILCVPTINVYHDCDESNNNGISWKSYYGTRNYLDMAKLHFTNLQYIYEIFYLKLRILKKFFTNKAQYRLLKTSYTDYKHNKFGISEVYKPGTKIE